MGKKIFGCFGAIIVLIFVLIFGVLAGNEISKRNLFPGIFASQFDQPQSVSTILPTGESSAESSSESSSEESSSSSSSKSENMPYLVDIDSLLISDNDWMKFEKTDSFNVPTSFILTKTDTDPSAYKLTIGRLNISGENAGSEKYMNYEAKVSEIPTKQVKIFSADSFAVRTVNVNTQIKLTKDLNSSNDSDKGYQHTGDILYLFNNNSGSISLITPNYAGNVESDQVEIMLEYLQE